jgi:hypothetical protein
MLPLLRARSFVVRALACLCVVCAVCCMVCAVWCVLFGLQACGRSPVLQVQVCILCVLLSVSVSVSDPKP